MNARIGAVVTTAWIISVAGAHAGAREDALEAVAKCAAVADDHARLACYDSSAPKVKGALATPAEAPTAEDQTSSFGLSSLFGGSGRPAQTTPQQFGNEHLPPPPPPAPVPGQPTPPAPPPLIESIEAGVSDYAFNPYGRFIVFLDNGQIWRQVEGDTGVARFNKSGGNKVTISRGMIGSYNLQVNDLPRVFKVTRLK